MPDPPERAVAIWEAASGLRADPAALRWWELFASVKGLGIWVSSAKEYSEGANHDPVLAFTGWWRRHLSHAFAFPELDA